MEVSNGVACPHCNHEYVHRTSLPDVCTNCFEIINHEPKSEVFAVPDYLSFQVEDKMAELQKAAKGQASTTEAEAISTEQAVQFLTGEAKGELESFLRTITFVTAAKALGDVELIIKHLPNNYKIKKPEMQSLIKNLKRVSDAAQGIACWLDNGGEVLYERRVETIKASELGSSARNTGDVNEAGN